MRLMLTTLFVITSVLAAAADDNHTKARLIADHEVIASGQSFLLGVHLEMDDHWHTYWENPGFAGLPTELKLEPLEGLEVGPLEFAFPKKFVDEAGFISYGYDDEVVLVARATYTGSAKNLEINASIEWLECKVQCIQGKKKTSLKLAVGDAKPANKSLFAKYTPTVPAPFGPDSPFTFEADMKFEAEQWIGTLTVSPKNGWTPKPEDTVFYPFKNEEGEMKSAEMSIKDGNIVFDLKYEAWDAVPEDLAMGGALRLNTSQGMVYSRINLWPKAAQSRVVMASAGATAAPEAGQEVTEGATVAAESGGMSGGFFYFALLAFIGGMILNLMPCVLPVLSLKVFALISDAGESAFLRIRNAWVYTLGIMASFLVLSIFFALSKTAGEQLGIGFQLSNPGFVIFMSILLFIMGLGFFGIFQFGAPNSDKLNNLSQKSGIQGAFFMGVLMTLLSTPCTAPFLGAAYGWTLSQSIPVILIIFQVIALGLAMPYVVLCYMPKLLRFLPKPGPWMEHVKVAMGFLMLGAMVWLLSVLAGLTGPDGVIGLLVLMLPIGLGAYYIGTTWYTSARPAGIIISLILVAGGYQVGMRDLFQLTDPYKAKNAAREELRLELLAAGGGSGDLFAELEKKVTTADEIAWVPYTPETLDYFRSKNRLVFLDFTADWCLTCKANERLVIDTGAIRKLFEEHNVVAMKGDYTEMKDEHTKFLNSFNRAGVPLYVVYPGQSDHILLPETITKGIVSDAVTNAAIQVEQAASR